MLESERLILNGAHGDALVVNKLNPASAGAPTIVFLPGYRSDRSGGKAIHVEVVCQRQGWGSVRLDYHAHGESPGDFLAGSISRWTNNVLDVIDQVTDGPLILVGSSMGGWIMLRAAIARSARVKALLGLAAAADFTQDLMLPTLSKGEREQLRDQGYIAQPTPYSDEPYLVTQHLLDDGADCLVLPDGIAFEGPVTLVHGLLDADVPLSTAMQTMEALSAADVYLKIIKDAGHRLSRESDLAVVEAELIHLAIRAGFEV